MDETIVIVDEKNAVFETEIPATTSRKPFNLDEAEKRVTELEESRKIKVSEIQGIDTEKTDLEAKIAKFKEAKVAQDAAEAEEPQA